MPFRRNPHGEARVSHPFRENLRELSGASTDYDGLVHSIGDASLVLLGEGSHGTHEFYEERAQITRRLITEKGFNAVAVEADWPDAYRVNRFVRGNGHDRSADEALSDFRRFPAWMWRNTVVGEFIAWLRARNQSVAREKHAGFYGLDLYSLFSSIEAVLRVLEKIDPAAAERARHRYACFEDFGEDSQAYGYAASFDMSQSCEDAVIRQLTEMRRLAAERQGDESEMAAEDIFSAEQNARLVLNAERYYRSMFRGRASSWNLRDTHMAETVDALRGHIERNGRRPKIVIWAHNSHLGDARATEMGDSGELNLGQLIRQRHRKDAVLVGFTTNRGTVRAASDWDGEGEVKDVRPALTGSYEKLFSEVGASRFYLDLRALGEQDPALNGPCLERAIGVIYRPETERMSHYFHARIVDQFDAVIHIDETRAVTPLAPLPEAPREDPPETYPTGF